MTDEPDDAARLEERLNNVVSMKVRFPGQKEEIRDETLAREAARTLAALRAERAVLTGRMCITCGRVIPGTMPRDTTFPECGDADYQPCNFDMTMVEAWQYWRTKYHELRKERTRDDSKISE